MGYLNMIILAGVIVVGSLYMYIQQKNQIYFLEQQARYNMFDDMWYIHEIANKKFDNDSTYQGFISPEWLISTPYGGVSSVIQNDTTIFIRGYTHHEDNIIHNAISTPTTYQLIN